MADLKICDHCGDCDGDHDNPACPAFNTSQAGKRWKEKAKADARALWAVRVLDAWAKKHEVQFPGPSYLGVTSKVDGARLGYWRIFRGLAAIKGDYQGMFPSADAARICAAEGLVNEDPTLGS